MPVIKIDNPQGRNAGSSAKMVNYLDKENFQQGTEKQLYFNQDSDQVRSDEVIKGLDENKGQLGKDQDKFYSISTNFSQKELKHLEKLYPDKTERQEKIKEYQREVMDEYAKNFNKGLKGEDLRYYGKIETQRHYKGTDEEVKQGKAKQGELKQGDQTHVHTLVSRKDQANKIKLSPLTNHKNTSRGAVQGGFNRSEFQSKCQQTFDKKFEYKRGLEEHYEYNLALKQSKTLSERKELLTEVRSKIAFLKEESRRENNKKQQQEQKKDIGMNQPEVKKQEQKQTQEQPKRRRDKGNRLKL